MARTSALSRIGSAISSLPSPRGTAWPTRITRPMAGIAATAPVPNVDSREPSRRSFSANAVRVASSWRNVSTLPPGKRDAGGRGCGAGVRGEAQAPRGKAMRPGAVAAEAGGHGDAERGQDGQAE